MQKIYLLLVRTLHSPIANDQVNAKLINEFLVVKSQTKIGFGKFHRIAGLVLAQRIKLLIPIFEYLPCGTG